MIKKVFLAAKGNVQDVMFRQTILRAAVKNGLVAGATNCYYDPDRVDISIQGNDEKIQKFVSSINSGRELNSWGAKVNTIEYLDQGREPLDHQINTENFQKINWRDDVVFYI